MIELRTPEKDGPILSRHDCPPALRLRRKRLCPRL
jgi:hypothetical protein